MDISPEPSIVDVEDAPVTVTARSMSAVPCEFLCGVAGSGKTFTVMQRVAEDPSWGLVTASTGIAAVNLNTTTINSVLKYFDTASLLDAYISGRLLNRIHELSQEYRWLVIDEISMVDARQLDIIYRAMRDVNTHPNRPPMGFCVVGDFAQLAPVKAPWAFEASCWEHFAANTIKLTKVWRQEQGEFLQALNHARAGRGQEASDILSDQGVRWHTSVNLSFDGTTLVPTNAQVSRHNAICLDRIPGKKFSVTSRRWGKLRSEWGQNRRTGEWGIPPSAEFRIGAYVMLLANSPGEDARRMEYVNGDCGHIEEWNPDTQVITIRMVRESRIVRIGKLVRDVITKDRPEGYVDERAEAGEFLPKPHRNDKGKYVEGQVEYFPVRLAWATTIHKCVHPDTLVSSDKGIIPIRELTINNHIWNGQDMVKVRAVVATSKRLWRITTRRGYTLMASGDHPIKSGENFVSIRNLKYGDPIELSVGLDYGDTLSYDTAWLIGLLVGDGSYRDRRDGTIEICKNDPDLWDRAQRALASYQVRLCIRKDKRGAYFTSKRFRKMLLETFGMGYDLAPNKDIPLKIWKGADYVRGEFLQGLFDADGSVGRSCITLTTSSDSLGRGVQLMLLSLGITSSRGTYRVKYKGEYRNYYQVRVSRAMYAQFKLKVNFSKKNKKVALDASPAPRKNCIRRLSELMDTISVIEDLGVEIPMVDLEVDGEHVFVANGLVTHNSQGLSLDNLQFDFRHHFAQSPGMVYVALSRCRTLEGLRLVGQREVFAGRCKCDARIVEWL